MKENKHEADIQARNARKQARNAKRLLKSEKRDKNNEKHIAARDDAHKKSESIQEIKIIDRDNKKSMKIDAHDKKISDDRKKVVALNDKKKLAKFDKKIKAQKAKKTISEINKANSKPKGKRYIDNSTPQAIIDVVNVTKSYTTKSLVFNALENVSFTINKGEFIVILGPSGSGKSTLLNVISGLDRPTSGDIIIQGENVSALKDSQLTTLRRNKIGFVFQSYNLLPTLNVSDNVEIGRSLQQNQSKRMDIKKVLADMSMFDQINKRTYELSGGQQQRVSIARALAKSPDILIGDEPTGALDTKTRKEVFQIFKDINKNKKTTIIIVTHNPAIAELADKAIYVKDGSIDKIVIRNKNNARK